MKKYLVILSPIFILLILYIFYFYTVVRYSNGRKGMDNFVQNKLHEILTLQSKGENILKIINDVNGDESKLDDFFFVFKDQQQKCYGIDSTCIIATSRKDYRGENDIFLIGVTTGKIHQVQNMGPKSFFNWLLLK